MSKQDSQDKLINFAMQELNKVLQDIQQGKTPEMSAPMQKLSQELEMVESKHKNMTEKEVKDFAEKLLKDISELE